MIKWKEFFVWWKSYIPAIPITHNTGITTQTIITVLSFLLEFSSSLSSFFGIIVLLWEFGVSVVIGVWVVGGFETALRPSQWQLI